MRVARAAVVVVVASLWLAGAAAATVDIPLPGVGVLSAGFQDPAGAGKQNGILLVLVNNTTEYEPVTGHEPELEAVTGTVECQNYGRGQLAFKIAPGTLHEAIAPVRIAEPGSCVIHLQGTIGGQRFDRRWEDYLSAPEASAASKLPIAAAAVAGAAVLGGAGAVLARRRRRDGDAGPARPAGLPRSFGEGRYVVVRFLGEGAMKRVYLVHDARLDRDVAYARIKTDGVDRGALERVGREAQSMARLGDHPNVVTVHDTGEEDGTPYIITQYMEGGSVDDVIREREGKPLPFGQALHIGSDVCHALEHAHAKGIVHRDVKPGNVWLTADGTAKLGDFGLAIALDRSRITVEKTMFGTVAYMSPEQARGETPDARSDLYSLGCLLYELATGRPPFVGDGAPAILSQHLHATADAPSRHNRQLTKPFDELVMALLEKSPLDRPDSAAGVGKRLARLGARRKPAGPVAAQSAIEAVAMSVQQARPSLQEHAAKDGTVTMMFTDIESSTPMTERYGDRGWLEILKRHNAIVREQIGAHGGFEVDSQGDGFMIAFSSARRALNCAIAIQQSVSKVFKKDPVRVRIGIHTGEAIKDAAKFFGRHVHLAARVGGHAQGGEILVSSITRELVQGEDFSFGPAREVELKGLSGSYAVAPLGW